MRAHKLVHEKMIFIFLICFGSWGVKSSMGPEEDQKLSIWRSYKLRWCLENICHASLMHEFFWKSVRMPFIPSLEKIDHKIAKFMLKLFHAIHNSLSVWKICSIYNGKNFLAPTFRFLHEFGQTLGGHDLSPSRLMAMDWTFWWIHLLPVAPFLGFKW